MIKQLDKKLRLLVEIIVISLFISIISTSYAYFTIMVNGKSKNNVVESGNMMLSFEDGPKIEASNFLPGQSIIKTFKVKNTGSLQTTYDVYFSETLNTFVDKEDLVYRVISSNGCSMVNEKVVPSTSGEKIVNQCMINPEETHSYTLYITFKETNVDQNSNQGKIFTTSIGVNEFNNHKYIETELMGAYPQIYDGLIPVTIDETGETKGTVRVADISSEWYDYSKHNWANAVIVSNPSSYQVAGTTINMDDILQMYVWIPRYRYKLWNAENGSSNEQMIEIEFEDKNKEKSTGSANGEWLTHPAFTFGSTELEGFWVGKFETGYSGASDSASAQVYSVDASKVIIKPGVYSWRGNDLGNMFNITRNVESESMYGLTASKVDTHMMKNMEWGAVAYLSHSQYGRYTNSTKCIDSGCEIWINPTITCLTGYSGTSVSSAIATGVAWNDSTHGGKSSTTGNLTGIYDMSGGSWEYVMGNVAMASTYSWKVGSSGLSTAPESRYYDAYTNSQNANTAHANGKLGDAIKETLKTFGSTSGGWHADYVGFPNSSAVWLLRGGGYRDGFYAGAFYFGNDDGSTSSAISWRVVLSAQ